MLTLRETILSNPYSDPFILSIFYLAIICYQCIWWGNETPQASVLFEMDIDLSSCSCHRFIPLIHIDLPRIRKVASFKAGIVY